MEISVKKKFQITWEITTAASNKLEKVKKKVQEKRGPYLQKVQMQFFVVVGLEKVTFPPS